MSCSTFDLKGYFLGEFDERDRRLVEEHLAGCADCREELERLRMTHTALLSVKDEEIPKRIAFVSDKVFEPRWWQVLWQSGPRLGFASAAMLSVAILVHAYVGSPPAVGPAPVDTAAIEAVVEKEVARRLQAVVEKAVAGVEARQTEKTTELLAAAEQRFEIERQADRLAVQEIFEVLRKRVNIMHLASAYRGGQ
jgi:anti-sigma factor RsiW